MTSPADHVAEARRRLDKVPNAGAGTVTESLIAAVESLETQVNHALAGMRAEIERIAVTAARPPSHAGVRW